jgi:hypothetical protein
MSELAVHPVAALFPMLADGGCRISNPSQSIYSLFHSWFADLVRFLTGDLNKYPSKLFGEWWRIQTHHRKYEA